MKSKVSVGATFALKNSWKAEESITLVNALRNRDEEITKIMLSSCISWAGWLLTSYSVKIYSLLSALGKWITLREEKLTSNEENWTTHVCFKCWDSQPLIIDLEDQYNSDRKPVFSRFERVKKNLLAHLFVALILISVVRLCLSV